MDGNEKLYDLVQRSKDAATVIDAPSNTVQSDRDEADINVLVRRFGLVGEMPTSLRLPSYGDYDVVMDYQSALEVVREAELEFLKLPPELRERFGNSPQAFFEVSTAHDAREKLSAMGLDKFLTPVQNDDAGKPPVSEDESK